MPHYHVEVFGVGFEVEDLVTANPESADSYYNSLVKIFRESYNMRTTFYGRANASFDTGATILIRRCVDKTCDDSQK